MDISPTGFTFTFHLRKNVRFTTAIPTPAPTPSSAYRFMVDPKTPTPYSGHYLLVTEAAPRTLYLPVCATTAPSPRPWDS